MAPGHYRLSTETWMTILEEYKQGATTTLLAAKWKVSEHALRKRITVHGATKRDWGDACARAGAEAWDEEVAAAHAPLPPLTPPEEGAAAATDARTLGQRVLRGVGRALDQGRLEEAKALGALAASLGRIPEQDSDRVSWADYARTVMDPTAAIALSLEDEDGLMTTHPAKLELWRRLTGSEDRDPLALRKACMVMMLRGMGPHLENLGTTEETSDQKAFRQNLDGWCRTLDRALDKAGA